MNISKDISFIHYKVISCKEAAVARNIPLKKELKSIILKTPYETLAVHLCGSDKINSKKIKIALNVKEIRFATALELESFRLKSGLINPWNINFCERHLVCKRVFDNDFMATNNGTYTEGIRLKPKELLTLKNVEVGDYSCC